MVEMVLQLFVRMFARFEGANPAHVPGGGMEFLTSPEECARGGIMPC